MKKELSGKMVEEAEPRIGLPTKATIVLADYVI